MSHVEPAPEVPAASPGKGSEEPAARAVAARRKTPIKAFLLGALAIGVLGAVLYFLLAGREETGAPPVQAVVTDEIGGLPVPDGRAITAQVDAALAQAPRDPSQPAEQAAAAAQAQTAPEADDAPAAVEAPTAREAEAAVERDASRAVLPE